MTRAEAPQLKSACAHGKTNAVCRSARPSGSAVLRSLPVSLGTRGSLRAGGCGLGRWSLTRESRSLVPITRVFFIVKRGIIIVAIAIVIVFIIIIIIIIVIIIIIIITILFIIITVIIVVVAIIIIVGFTFIIIIVVLLVIFIGTVIIIGGIIIIIIIIVIIIIVIIIIIIFSVIIVDVIIVSCRSSPLLRSPSSCGPMTAIVRAVISMCCFRRYSRSPRYLLFICIPALSSSSLS